MKGVGEMGMGGMIIHQPQAPNQEITFWMMAQEIIRKVFLFLFIKKKNYKNIVLTFYKKKYLVIIIKKMKFWNY